MRAIDRPAVGVSLAALLLVGTVVTAVPAVRTPILRGAGWALVIDDPIDAADIIVVTTDAGRAGVLEAADLVRAGIATRVAVFASSLSSAERELVRRGIPVDRAAAQSVRQLQLLGVPSVEEIPATVVGTEDAARLFPDWCDQQRVSSIVVVSSADHSRRLRRVLDRAMRGRAARVRVRYARYSQFAPDRWWRTRDGVRTEIVELQKLLLDIARHPFS